MSQDKKLSNDTRDAAANLFELAKRITEYNQKKKKTINVRMIEEAAIQLSRISREVIE